MKLAHKLFLVIWCLAVLGGCQSAHNQNLKHTAPVILVVNSNGAVPRYEIAQTAFNSTLRHASIISIDLGNDNKPTETLQDALNQHQIGAIYCIGAKALGSIDYLAPSAPVVYSSVLSWRQFQNEPNRYGVTSEVGPEQQLTWFKHFFPQIKRLGILYSATNTELVTDAKRAADALSLSLKVQQLADNSDRELVTRQLLSEVDALWILPDPRVLESESSTYQMFELAHQARKPVFTYNNFFMGLGATLSINADLATTGRQAGLIARTLMELRTPGQSVQLPAGTSISLNLGKVKDNNLTLNEEALNAVSELLEH